MKQKGSQPLFEETLGPWLRDKTGIEIGEVQECLSV
jgi:hypothetical protein